MRPERLVTCAGLVEIHINVKEAIDMPFGDGTGPSGMGSMTGRGAGYCAGYPVPGYANPVPGYGMYGRGFRGGGGRGRRNRFYATGLYGWQRAVPPYPAYAGAAPYTVPPQAPMNTDQELEALKGQAKYFAESLEGIQQRIAELEKEAAAK